jgi:hypothetical protein
MHPIDNHLMLVLVAVAGHKVKVVADIDHDCIYRQLHRNLGQPVIKKY